MGIRLRPPSIHMYVCTALSCAVMVILLVRTGDAPFLPCGGLVVVTQPGFLSFSSLISDKKTLTDIRCCPDPCFLFYS